MSDQERDLIEKSKQGDIDSFEKLIRDHQQLAFNIAYRMLGNIEDAKDVSQDAFIKIFKSINSYKGDSSFSTWLYRIVTNTCIDELRKRNKRQILSYDIPIATEEGEVERNLPDPGPTPEDIVDRKESQRKIRDAINNLNEQHKAVIVLRDIKGFSYDQISEILECPEGTIKSRISRARSALKSLLEKEMELYKDDYVKI